MAKSSLISTCCRVRLWLRNLAGIVVWRDVKGRKIADALCPQCQCTYDIDIGKAD
jgi:Zn ribbon nucleic-acid-binding protein